MFRVVPKVTRRSRAMPLRSHLLIFSLLLLLPVMIFVGLLLVRYSTSERAKLEEQAVATAVRTAAEIDRELASLTTILATLAAAPSLLRRDFRDFHIQATSALTSRKLYVALINADDGQQLVNTRVPFGTPLPSSGILEREARHLMLESGRPYISDLESGIVAQRPVLGVAVPVRQGDTTPYMLVIAFDPAHLVGILRQSELPHGWAAGVVDRAGITIARSQLHEERVGKPMMPDARREALGERGVAIVTNFQGQTMFYSQARSKLSGWLIWTNVPTRIIDAELRKTFWILTAMGISVALLSIVLAFTFGRRMAQPIQLAAQEAKSLGLGQAIRPSTSPLLEANDLMDALHSASREISDRTNALTDEMRRREEAQAALLVAQRREAFGQLAAGIAHDFNNILAVILGNNEILENRLSDQKGRELLRRSTNAAEMGASLTRRLLTFARQQPRTPILIDLNDRVLAMVELLRGSLSANIELSTKLAKDVGMTTADPSEVENAIMNLAINARDAMPNGGKLTFETRSVVVDGAQGLEPGNYVVLSVSDTGQGMAPEIVARAFEPFFTTKGAQGTGLGLATIYGFVKQSGGNVTIHSELGHGTTVALWLPIAKVSAEAVKQDHQTVAQKTAKGAQSLVVLAVDDNALVLMGTTAMLEGLGHRALKATSGKDALDILRREESVDLVITDQAMPGMTGAQLANVIKVEWPAMPILLVTGYAELPPGADDGLPKLAKPFGQQDLARAIGKAMEPDQESGRVVKFALANRG